MTGTSLDGVDAALARVRGRGLLLRAELVAHASAPLGALGPRLRAAAEQTPLTARDFASLALDLGEVCAAVAADLCARAGAAPDLASVHGQTIHHAPPRSWQILNPHPVARALECPVVFDLRGADVAEGGQGAPLTPLADWVLLRAPAARAVINLGGFANITLLPEDRGAPEEQVARVRGCDVCACNHLLDQGAREALGAPFDPDGTTAERGRVHSELAERLVARLAPAGRSLGTGDEAWETLEGWRAQVAPEDLLATICHAVARAIGRALASAGPRDVVVAGGGARNARLVREIREVVAAPVTSASDHGIPVEQRESLAWAVLGALAQDGAAVTLPAVTGRRAHALADGLWCLPATGGRAGAPAEPVLYDGAASLRLPAGPRGPAG